MARLNTPKSAVDPIRTLGQVASFASFGLFVIIVINYVDARYKYKNELANQENLIAQDSEQRLRLEQYHAESDRMSAKLVELDKRAITETELADVQDQLLGLARQYGCTIKKASPRGKIVRDFAIEHPTQMEAIPIDPNVAPGASEKEFEIHDAGLALNIEGDLKPTMEFLEAVKKQPWFTSTRQLVLRRDPNLASHLTTELELRFSSLQRCPDRSAADMPMPPRS